MKNTALTSVHESLGAKMVPFAGWNMPVQYTSIIDEHTAVREHAGIFDISHMGQFFVEGDGAGDLAVQAPPHAHQELLGEGRQGGLAGDPAWPWPCPPGCVGGGWLGLLLPIPWPTCRGAGGSLRGCCGSP